MAVTSTPHIALVGGGYTLQHLAEKLPAKSFVITSRAESTCARWLRRGWLAHRLDISDPGAIKGLFQTYPAITHLIDSVPPLREGIDCARGVKNVAAALATTQVKQVVYLSTTGVFGVRDGSWVDETTPPNPWNAQGRARFDCELAYRSSGRPVCAFRLPAIYGPDRGVAQSIRQGTYRMVGSGEAWTNRIHVEDLAVALERALGAKDLPDILCVSDDAPSLAKDVVAFVCAALKMPGPPSISEAEAIRQGAYTMLSNQRICNALMKKTLGLQLRYPSYQEGFIL